MLIPVKWQVALPEYPNPGDPRSIYVERRLQRDGTARYVLIQYGNVLARDGTWEYEPMPSSRTDDFIERTRFATPEEALAVLLRVP